MICTQEPTPAPVTTSPAAPATTKEQGTCATFGCNITFESKHSCQCNSECLENNNCCDDYKSHCLDPHAGCNIYGCNISYKRGNPCQCDADCWKYTEGCCSDWNSLCAYHVCLMEAIALLKIIVLLLAHNYQSLDANQVEISEQIAFA